MGDENTVLDETHARHLLRRATFGASRDELARLGLVGLSRGAAADALLALRTKRFRAAGPYFERAHAKWIKYLVKGKTPVQDRVVLFWHDHFSVSFSKVGDLRLMGDYVKALYAHGLGNFRDLVKEMNRTVAMMEFLDTVRNFKEVPNENYARELCELFTLGVLDSAGNANYSQEDVVQIARAFTGWNRNRRKAVFLDFLHDYQVEFPERGPKVLFPGAHGFPSGGASFTTGGEGPGEIDEVVDILLQHRDTDGRNTVSRRVARRLLEYYAYPDPELTVVDEVVAASGFDVDFDIRALLRAIFTHDAFYEAAAAAPFGAGTRKSVRWPVDYVVSALRLLRMRLKGGEQVLDGGSYRGITDHCGNMGQHLLDPPSVFGWDWEEGWLSTANLLGRYVFARDLSVARWGSKRFRPELFVDFDLTDPNAIVEAVADALDVVHHLDASTRTTLLDYLTDGGAVSSVNLHDPYYGDVKLRGLFALVLQSPAFLFH